MQASQMPSRRRSSAWIMTALLVALILATQAMWACIPARAEEADSALYRLEGFIRAKSPDRWLVGSDLDGYKIVAVNPQTVIIDKSGYAPELGAWVTVYARRSVGVLLASLIEVDRPAGAPGFPVQFAGTVTKAGKEDGFWKVGDLPVAVAPETAISDTVGLDSRVWIGAIVTESGLLAEWIRDLTNHKTVEFEGTLLEFGQDHWLIDDHQVEIGANTAIAGEPQAGMSVECRAVLSDDGTLTALELLVSPPSQSTRKTGSIIGIDSAAAISATWTVLIEQGEPGAEFFTATVQVDENTWVDQTRAVAQVDQWVRLRGTPTGPNSYHADLLQVEHGAQTAGASALAPSTPRDAGAAPWRTPATVASTLDSAEHSTIAFTRDGAAHAIWETNNRLFAAHQSPTGTWSAPEEVAYGFAPHMIAEDNGTLHVAFVNSFMGNFETYYVVRRNGKWSLPVNMSHTDGYSAHPKLAFGPDGVLHATWMDRTPGYWTTYHATWAEPFWSTRPIPSGRGEAPSIAVAQDGTVYVVWQDRTSPSGAELGAFEVFLAGLRDGTWTTPLNISDSRDLNTLGPDVTVTANGFAHIVWIEGDEHIRYSYGQAASWSTPTTIASAGGYANGVRIAVESDRFLHVAWDEEGYGEYKVHATSAPERTQEWPEDYLLWESSEALRDVCLAPNPSGGVGLSWTQTSEIGRTTIFASRREPMQAHRMWMPLVVSQ